MLFSSNELNSPDNNLSSYSYNLTIESLSSESESFTLEIISDGPASLKSTTTTKEEVTPFSKILRPGTHNVVVKHKNGKSNAIMSKIRILDNDNKKGSCQSDNNIVHLTAGPNGYCQAY